MVKKTLDRANELNRANDTLNSLRHIISYPYPEMFKKKKRNNRTGFVYDDEIISFCRLDEQTREELKTAIYAVITKRQHEIAEEMENL